MIVSMIVAMEENRGIGFQNRIPWHLGTDLKRFKELTMGHTLIMGRKTFESIGRPLPGRPIIVLTRNPGFHPEGVQVAQSLDQALQIAEERGESEVFIAGGEEIFNQAMSRADRIYLTRVEAHLSADTFFPQWGSEWEEEELSRHPCGEKDEYAFTVSLLVKSKQQNI